MRVLALSAHTDDLELAAGGLVARLLDAGATVDTVAFSTAKESLPAGLAPDTLAREFRAASAALGIPTPNVHVRDYAVRNFPAARQAILDDMIRLRTQLRPDLVLTPCSDDMHQDHHTVYQESVRAFKHGSMLGYEMPWNTLVAATQMFVALERTHMERKLAALAEYKSQGTRPYAAPEFIRAWASTRGLSIGVPLAEAFQVIRWVWPGNAIEKPAAP